MELHTTTGAEQKIRLPGGLRRRTLAAGLLLLGPAVTVIACQAISLQSWGEAAAWIGGQIQAAGLTWLLLVCAAVFSFGVTRLAGLSLLLVQTVPVALTLVSYYKAVINGEPLRLSDFALAGNFGDVAGFALDRITISPVTGSALAAAVALVLLGIVLDVWTRKNRPAFRSSMAAAGISLVVLAVTVAGWAEPFCTVSYETYTTQAGRDDACGVSLSLLSALIGAKNQGSEDYGEARMMRVMGDMWKDQEAQPMAEEKPHIIFVMNESFMDVTRLPNVAFSQDPVSNYHALQSSSQYGRFYSVTSGGGTGWAEMEALTGVPPAMLDPAKANTELSAEEYAALPSYVQTLSENGYHTIGFHAHTSEMYNRAVTFPEVGFDEMHFYEEYMQEGTYTGGYFDDNSSADVIISLFEENREDPCYIYAMTMQNHQPYYAGRYDEDPVTVSSDRLTEEELAVLQCYTDGIWYADQMLGKLVDYFSQVDEPVILVFAGDHTASMSLSEEETVYSKVGYVSAARSSQWTEQDYMEMLSTDYILWANYDLSGMTRGRRDMAAYMMGAEVLGVSGVANTPYFAWVRETGRTLFTYRWGDLRVDAEGRLVDELSPEAEDFYTEWEDVIYDTLYGEHYISSAINRIREES